MVGRGNDQQLCGFAPQVDAQGLGLFHCTDVAVAEFFELRGLGSQQLEKK